MVTLEVTVTSLVVDVVIGFAVVIVSLWVDTGGREFGRLVSPVK